jgi:1,4-dihydroxy-2-naphthoyl-CoA hydrolase
VTDYGDFGGGLPKLADSYPVPYEQTFDGKIGFEITEIGPERAVGRVRAGEGAFQRWGMVHGGVYAGLAEMIASEATGVGVWDEGKLGLGLANHTNFLRPVTAGWVEAEALRRHAGRTTWVWDVDMRDEHGRLCATSRVTIAIRDRP